jgi:uncharacterized protein (TIGR03435 family)
VRIATPLFCAVLLVAQAANAQTAAPAGAVKKIPAYDVVSIKPDNSGPNHLDVTVDDGNYTALNIGLATMIEDAYGYKRDQIIGLDGPMNSARFDIRAKVLDPADIKLLDSLTGAEHGSMLRAILTERFHLKFHTEMRELSVYELVQVKGGSKLHQTPEADKGKSDKTDFHGVTSGSVTSRGTRATSEFIAHDVTMLPLVSNLSSNLRHVVVDKTGLPGKYDVWLRWSREDLSGSMDKPADNGSQAEALPTLFTALQEQLGLHLQGGKDKIETMVIDGLDMPSPD